MGLYDIIKSMGSEMTGIAPSQRLMSQVTGETKPEAGFGLNMDTVNWIADLINNTVGVAGPAYGAAKMAPGLGRVLTEQAQKMPMRLADQTGAVGKITKPKMNTLEREIFDIGQGKMEDGYYVTVPPAAKGEGWIVEGPFTKKTSIEFLENEVGAPTGRIVQVRKGALAVPQRNPELDMFRGVDTDLDLYKPITPLSPFEDYRPKTVTDWSKK
jgi:hypothetical protein